MKVFEFAKNKIVGVTLDNMEPLWCAYSTRTDVEEAVCTLHHTVQSHLDGIKNFPWLLFMIFPLLLNVSNLTFWQVDTSALTVLTMI